MSAQTSEYAGLVVGLGNPGPQYERTRHNIGFLTLDAIAQQARAKEYRKYSSLKPAGDYEIFSATLPRTKGLYLFLKPLTYMNLSGKAALQVCMSKGLSPKNMLVVHDELDLPLGRMKLKMGGGTAGHNGLKSLVAELGTETFARLRLGIGRPQQHMAVRDWVLTPFAEDEEPVVQSVVDKAAAVAAMYFARGMAAAMQDAHPFDAAQAQVDNAQATESATPPTAPRDTEKDS